MAWFEQNIAHTPGPSPTGRGESERSEDGVREREVEYNPDIPNETAEKLLERILSERRAQWEAEQWQKEIIRAQKKAAQAKRKTAVEGELTREWRPYPERSPFRSKTRINWRDYRTIQNRNHQTHQTNLELPRRACLAA